MKPKTMMLLAVAGVCGLVAMLGVQQAMQGNGAQAKVETARVLVALTNIDGGVKLTEENVAFREMPVESLPEDVVRTPEDYADRAAQFPLVEGDVIRMSKLTNKGEWGRSTQIPIGMRVMTISVNDTHTASGLLQPGDRVDVLVTYQARDGNRGRITKTKTLLEYVEVFATDDRTQSKTNDGSESGKAKNVSLLLFPEQAQYVAVAMSKGTLGLLWRSKADDEIVQTKAIDEELFEELQGTAGANDDRPLYAQFDEEGPSDRADMAPIHREPVPIHREPVPEAEPAPKAGTPSEFLNAVDEEQASKQQLILASTPVKPKWTMRVYNGNQPSELQFEIPEDAAAAAAAAGAAEDGGSLSDVVKKLWNGGRAGD